MKIFIGCSSSDDIDDIYKNSALDLAEKLSKKDNELICGGNDGLMKIFHDTFLKNSKVVTIKGVKNYYKIVSLCPNIYYYDTISDRKKAIIEEADILIFLPGGIGTFDEIFSFIESKRANEHNKPIVIANINNYYNKLLEQLDKMYKECFANSNNKKYYYVANNVEEIISYISK